MEVSRETIIERYFPDTKRVRAYVDFLRTSGIERGLIGPHEGEIIWERHIFNCLPVTTLISGGASIFDIGSGAGLPGVVIAMARPDLKVTLIEPLERRVQFLKEATIGLNIEIIHGRAEDVKKQSDYVTARAVAPLEKLKKISWHLLKVGGSLLAIKGKSALIEMENVPKSILHEINCDGIELTRVVELRKGG